jgi:predicted ferric reductase
VNSAPAFRPSWKLHAGQEVKIEGPYGCFDFDEGERRQIWVGGGIGITPFIARLKHLALVHQADPDMPSPMVDLFHTTADFDQTAIGRLKADAKAANVRLHVLVDARDGLLTGERIRSAVRHGEKPASGLAGRRTLATRCATILRRTDCPSASGFTRSCSR